nr:ATP-binding protein [Pantoea pleuroti]
MCNNIRLEQVFVNILSNALDAVIENQTEKIVTAEWAIENNFAVIKIEDNGVGIAEENSGKIFDPFFTTKLNRGLGLGLSISADIIQSYNGTLSAGNGKAGACFEIRLPLANINEGN